MSVLGLQPRQRPGTALLTGRYLQLEKIDPKAHATGFERHLCGPDNATLWEYIPFDAPADSEMLFGILDAAANAMGWHSFAMRELASGEVKGTVSLMRIRPEHGSAEIGAVVFGHRLQRTPAATEAVYLIGDYLFSTLGYRRFEWKCDSLNAASRRAATRFGFAFEGIFRNDMIVKGRSRDTAWFAMTDEDWVRLKPVYELWLSGENFDTDGHQRRSLSDLAASVCVTG